MKSEYLNLSDMDFLQKWTPFIASNIMKVVNFSAPNLHDGYGYMVEQAELELIYIAGLLRRHFENRLPSTNGLFEADITNSLTDKALRLEVEFYTLCGGGIESEQLEKCIEHFCWVACDEREYSDISDWGFKQAIEGYPDYPKSYDRSCITPSVQTEPQIRL